MDDRTYRNGPRNERYGRYPQRGYGDGRDEYRGRGRGTAAYGERDYYGGERDYRRDDGPNYSERRGYRGSYMHDGHRETDYGANRRYRDDRDERSARRDYRDADERDRGFFERAGDEVRSWFGDEDAERRREMDQRYDARHGGGWDSPYSHDRDYHSWRRDRIDELDRDYAEYRRENAQRFHDEFSSFRTERQGQRASLNQVEEHMEVIGSDGSHVGTVDKVRGDRILLTKNDKDAGGHHHSIPSRWIESVADKKVTIRKTADQAHAEWRDEERNMAFFRDDDREDSRGHMLDRSFSGTY